MASVYEGLRDHFYNPRYSDLDIICQHGGRFKVHRVVIALNSTVLNKMVTKSVNANVRDLLPSFPFTAASFLDVCFSADERETNVFLIFQGRRAYRIELPAVNYDALFMTLQFLYSGNYNDYETVGSFHSPTYVVYMNADEIDARLLTLPCLHTDSVDLDDHDDEQEPDGSDSEEYEENVDGESSSEGDMDSEPSRNHELDEHKDNEDIDNWRVRTFQGHGLFDSLSVYCLASQFDIPALQLLARDRFYRTAEKVLMYQTSTGDGKEARWWTHDHQRIYRSKLVKAVFDDFPQVVRELYKTVPESDTNMRAIPAMLIAAGYNNDEFRDHMKPLLEEYPDLALAVLECMRMPNSEE
ncbi:hypothetical protein F4678DRAFT_394296 [Xylaria arbuscula]|nr:hypothetical protein F4678DRAFT_394296 [Xylaria arbuscula]